MSHAPHFGFTRLGLPVHARAADHLPAGKVNRWIAVKVTRGVGTMWCAYAFGAIALISLPGTLALHSVVADVQWVAQTFLQLVLLSVIIVGQNIAGEASDARAAKQFEDTEVLMDRMDTRTQGGLTEVLAAVKKVGGDLAGFAETVRSVVAALPPAEPPAPARAARKGTGT